MSAAPGPSARQVLEPCPFCGITPAFVHEVDYCTPSEWTVLCLNSECGVSHATEAEAITAWNRRATDPAVAELVEALADLLGWYTGTTDKCGGTASRETIAKARALIAKHAAKP